MKIRLLCMIALALSAAACSIDPYDAAHALQHRPGIDGKTAPLADKA